MGKLHRAENDIISFCFGIEIAISLNIHGNLAVTNQNICDAISN